MLCQSTKLAAIIIDDIPKFGVRRGTKKGYKSN
jgi:hypothetical protein